MDAERKTNQTITGLVNFTDLYLLHENKFRYYFMGSVLAYIFEVLRSWLKMRLECQMASFLSLH